MDNTTRQYNVSIFPCLETGSESSSSVHMEVAGDFRAFYEDAMDWIRAFHQRKTADDRFRIHEGEDKEDIFVCCDEAEVILSLLYCCKEHKATVREIRYQGSSYTDISDIRFSEGFVADKYGVGYADRINIRLHATKDGRDTLVYLFGPEFGYIPGDDYKEEFCIFEYPLSYGMVEIEGKQMHYAGTCCYPCYEEDDLFYYPNDDEVKICDYNDGVELFLETDGKNVTFSALLDGKLYKKISKDDEKIVFHSMLDEGVLLGKNRIYQAYEGGARRLSFWQCRDMQDVEFRKDSSGEYRYTGDNREVAEIWAGAAFVPPQTPDPDSLNQESAFRLCMDYINAFYAGRPAQIPEALETGAKPQEDAAVAEDKKIWAEFWKILKDIQGKYGLSAAEKAAYEMSTEYDEATHAEILYAACTFFSLENKELEELFPTEELRKEYETLKTVLKDYLTLQADPDVFLFSELRDIFARDFFYLNRITLPFHLSEREQWFLPIADDDVRGGRITEYSAIFTSVSLSGRILYNPDKYSRRDFLSIINYYRTHKTGEQSEKKEIDTVIALRKRLRAGLRARVKGQDMAIEKFVDGYIRYQIRGKVSGKPAGLYLFAGPPGTGKTYLAETFAGLKDMKEAGYQYRRFDMSAYGGSGDIVTGLVGFERTWKAAQPGQLTDFVRKNPKCILLFDEIEKASPQVRFLFLSVLEGAVLTDKYYNEQVSFEDAILIFTTNEGRDLYEDNREANLTALSDSAVIEGLQASKFAPELISRFMSGTIVMFNHLDYFNMSAIFENSVNEAAAQICRNRDNLHFDLVYDDKLSKLYLLSKGDRIDARFISANVRKTVEDHFLKAVEYMGRRCPGKLGELKKASVSVDVTENVRKYFEMTERLRILLYAEEGIGLYTGETARLRSGFLPEKGLKELGLMADCDLAEQAESERAHEKSFRKLLQNCNWNSRRREDRYDAILIDLGKDSKNFKTSEGYKCLKAAAEAKPDIPIIVVDRGAVEDKAPFLSLGVTDFVRGTLYKPQSDPMDEGNPEGLALDREDLTAIFARQHFVKMAGELARERKRLACDAVYEYAEKEPGELEIRFTDLRVESAEEEDAESRRQNRKYLLAERPQVRVKDIFGNALVKEAVERCIDNIRNPEKYRNAEAKLMTGILMYGAPGMGKTMFAKAMAFEANASFISAVGADFLSGDGVLKMEEMFRTARRRRPCIFFIDEFDAISKDRGSYGMTSYQETVLDKFLKEMDGLETDNNGVYVVAATNYSLEDLDPAVTRRFSARIHIPYPTLEERQRFLLDLLEKKGLKDRISERAARTLSLMMSGKIRNYAEIKTFLEESIADAVYKTGSAESVTEKFLFDRVHAETDGAVWQEKDLDKYMATAFHEAGHAVLQHYFGRKLAYVTIVSRGNYGGYAMAEPKYEIGQDFLNQICVSFAGRAAETLYMEHISRRGGVMGINVGAESDLQKATQIAYEYVCRFGLSERNMVVPWRFASRPGEYPEAALPESEKEAIWKSVKQVLDQEWQNAVQILRRFWDQVEALAWSLIYMQELDGEKAERVIRNRTVYMDESCFGDSDSDYIKEKSDDTETMIPLGFPVYPYHPYFRIKTQPETEDMAGKDGNSGQYFYAVKDAENPQIFGDLQKAFAAAREKGAKCRRFVSEEAAREYLGMLELKVFRQGDQRFCNLYEDALAEMAELALAEKEAAAQSTDKENREDRFVKELIVLKEGELVHCQAETDEAGVMRLAVLGRKEISWYQAKAAENGMSFAWYLMEGMAERFLEDHEKAYLVIQIYDRPLQEELLHYLNNLEYVSNRYRRNLGYTK